jgi:hypothetical protein
MTTPATYLYVPLSNELVVQLCAGLLSFGLAAKKHIPLAIGLACVAAAGVA